MTRLRGRAPHGARRHAQAPTGHWRTTTLIGVLRLDGATACMAIEGATDTEVFRASVQEILCPVLRPGDLVVMDNLAAHKNEHTLDLIRTAGATPLFLPAYSPDMNPIEMMWSKVKALLRNAAARTREGLLEAIASALAAVTPKDTLHWFAACGYNFI